MAGFGIPFGGFDQETGDIEDREYDPDVVFKNFKNSMDETPQRSARMTHSRTTGGVPVETRHRRIVKMPY